MTSTVSYKFRTTPSSSTMGTAEMERSENMWTTSKTEVSILAVSMGQYGWLGSGEGEATKVPILSLRKDRCSWRISL